MGVFSRGLVIHVVIADLQITLLTSREEGILGMVVQLIFQAMINFTTGVSLFHARW